MATPAHAATFVCVPAASYLLAVGQLSHGMSSYRIDAESGRLTKLKEYPMGKNPNWVETCLKPLTFPASRAGA